MSSSTTSIPVIKDEFTKVLTEGELSPTNKPADRKVVFTENSIIEDMCTPSPPSKTLRRGLAAHYNSTFSTEEEY